MTDHVTAIFEPTTDSSVQITNTEQTDNILITPDMLKKLCSGSFRVYCLAPLQYDINCDDLVEIIYQYAKGTFSKCHMKFHHHPDDTIDTSKKVDRNTSHRFSTVLFKNALSTDTAMNNIKHNKASNYKICIEMQGCQCNKYPFFNIGYCIQIGIICIPKSYYNNYNKKQKHDDTATGANIDNNCNTFFTSQIKKDSIDLSLHTIWSLWTNLNSNSNSNDTDDCYDHDDDASGDVINTYYLSCVNFVKSQYNYRGIPDQQCDVSFGKNGDIDHVTFEQTNEAFIDVCDTITVHIDFEKENNAYYMYFIKNNKHFKLIGDKTNEKEWQNGKVKLDVHNNYYYFGLSSVVCGCKESQGFEFQVSV